MTEHTEKTAIANLQRYLRAVYLEDPRITAPPVDGIWESDTENALKAFQAAQGLPVTGIADQETWELLFAAYRATLAYSYLPRPMQIFPVNPRDFALQLGDRSFPVAALQYALRELEHILGDPFAVEADGIYGEETQAAVIAFQRRNRLPPNGRVDLLTWNRIMDQYNSLIVR